jgi:hypothetical protein
MEILVDFPGGASLLPEGVKVPLPLPSRSFFHPWGPVPGSMFLVFAANAVFPRKEFGSFSA